VKPPSQNGNGPGVICDNLGFLITAEVLLGDINLDGDVNFSDISPFISVWSNSRFQAEAGCLTAVRTEFR